ncbi:unnamed protein product [Ilex paraguariensis]|uniref:Retrotransposon gag domain-containing protein n=1 Tax=Ilex paraguariensis TaxID=185542 RepID=A0ABC8STA4_9AQUA
MHLTKFNTAKQIWDYLTTFFVQSNFAKRYQLEHEIRAARQGDKTIQKFYSVMIGFWDQLILAEPAQLSTHMIYCTFREEQRLVQFLMALADDFEGLRGSILHLLPLLIVDAAVNELLAKEVRLKTLFEKGLLSLPIRLYWLYHIEGLLIHKLNIGVELHLMSVVFVVRRIIGRLNVLNW